MDFTTGLPLDIGCNTIYTYMDKLTKFARIVPCEVIDGDLLVPATEKPFFDYIFCS